MGTTYAVGSDGTVTTPTGYKAHLNSWSASLTRKTTVITGFGSTGAERNVSSVLDVTGSAGGTPMYDASSTSALGITSSAAGGALYLSVNGADSAAEECSLAFNAVFNSVAFSSAQDGDATVTFNFEIAEPANAFAFTWYEV